MMLFHPPNYLAIKVRMFYVYQSCYLCYASGTVVDLGYLVIIARNSAVSGH